MAEHSWVYSPSYDISLLEHPPASIIAPIYLSLTVWFYNILLMMVLVGLPWDFINFLLKTRMKITLL